MLRDPGEINPPDIQGIVLLECLTYFKSFELDEEEDPADPRVSLYFFDGPQVVTETRVYCPTSTTDTYLKVDAVSPTQQDTFDDDTRTPRMMLPNGRRTTAVVIEPVSDSFVNADNSIILHPGGETVPGVSHTLVTDGTGAVRTHSRTSSTIDPTPGLFLTTNNPEDGVYQYDQVSIHMGVGGGPEGGTPSMISAHGASNSDFQDADSQSTRTFSCGDRACACDAMDPSAINIPADQFDTATFLKHNYIGGNATDWPMGIQFSGGYIGPNRFQVFGNEEDDRSWLDDATSIVRSVACPLSEVVLPEKTKDSVDRTIRKTAVERGGRIVDASDNVLPTSGEEIKRKIDDLGGLDDPSGVKRLIALWDAALKEAEERNRAIDEGGEAAEDAIADTAVDVEELGAALAGGKAMGGGAGAGSRSGGLLGRMRRIMSGTADDAAKASDDVATKTSKNSGNAGRTKAEVLAENKKNGAAFEKKVKGAIEEVQDNVREQITVKVKDGTKTRLDLAGTDRELGGIAVTECKASATAPLTKKQARAFPQIEETGAEVVGKGKPPYTGGTRIPPQKVKIIKPGDLK